MLGQTPASIGIEDRPDNNPRPCRSRIAFLTRRLSCCARVALAASAFVVCSVAGADETYYVRESGSDGANGLTPDTAFRTIMHAVQACDGAGNTIYVGPGTYHEQIEIGIGGGSAADNGTAADRNRIMGDVSGEMTEDDAGPVVVDGENIRQYGIRIQNRSYWTVQHLTLSNQRSYSVYAYDADQFTLSDCVLNVPSSYGVFAYRGDDLQIERNTLARDAASGHCMYIYGCGGKVRISRNRMSLLGDLYLSTGFGDGFSSWKSYNSRCRYTYGIIALSLNIGNPVDLLIDNNVLSDVYLGIYAITYNSKDRVKIACNTIAGALYGMYTLDYGGKATISDNIVTNSYYAAYGYSRRSKIKFSGLLTYDVRYDEPTPKGMFKTDGLLKDTDPKWLAPASGDFSLQAGSPAIDAGSGLVSLASDIRGVSRPFDGDKDGQADNDLGAYEYDYSFDEQSPPRVVRWREREIE